MSYLTKEEIGPVKVMAGANTDNSLIDTADKRIFKTQTSTHASNKGVFYARAFVVQRSDETEPRFEGACGTSEEELESESERVFTELVKELNEYA